MRIAVSGSSGFIGSAICTEARRLRFETVPLVTPRLAIPDDETAAGAARSWIARNPRQYTRSVRTLGGVDVLINAAGSSAPDSDDVPSLRGGNATLPTILAMAAREAGVRRMVHISTSAVQGRREPLDESTAVEPLTPYARSKAEGESVLLERGVPVPDELTIYRPTSVQGLDRAITRQLVRLAGLPVVPLCAGGDVPLPTGLVENVAAGVLAVCAAERLSPVVLHPWEGMTARGLFAAFGPARPFPVPASVVRVVLSGLYASGSFRPRSTAIARRLELLAFGQTQHALFLAKALAFTVPVGAEGYVRLAEQVRLSSAAARGDVPTAIKGVQHVGGRFGMGKGQRMGHRAL